MYILKLHVGVLCIQYPLKMMILFIINKLKDMHIFEQMPHDVYKHHKYNINYVLLVT